MAIITFIISIATSTTTISTISTTARGRHSLPCARKLVAYSATGSLRKTGSKRECITGWFVPLPVLHNPHAIDTRAVCPPIWKFFYSVYGGGPVIARGDGALQQAHAALSSCFSEKLDIYSAVVEADV
jgi:hypothetical protein